MQCGYCGEGEQLWRFCACERAMHTDCLPRRATCASCGEIFAWTDRERAVGFIVYFAIAVGFAAFTVALLDFIHITVWSYVAVGAAWSMWVIMSWSTARDLIVRDMAVPVVAGGGSVGDVTP